MQGSDEVRWRKNLARGDCHGGSTNGAGDSRIAAGLKLRRDQIGRMEPVAESEAEMYCAWSRCGDEHLRYTEILIVGRKRKILVEGTVAGESTNGAGDYRIAAGSPSS